MIARLRPNKANASCANMQGKITALLLVFAILFGSVIMPTIAHAQAPSASHSEEFLELHEHDEAGDQDTQQQDGDKPCHAVAHHHCSIALRVETDAMTIPSTWLQNSFVPSSPAAMASYSQAPPTEPPAA